MTDRLGAAPTLFAADFTVDIDERVYTKSTVIRTCYALGDRCHTVLEQISFGQLRVHCKIRDATPADAVKAAFAEALIDFSLREIIEEKTRTVRDVIVRTALAEATAPNPVSSSKPTAP